VLTHEIIFRNIEGTSRARGKSEIFQFALADEVASGNPDEGHPDIGETKTATPAISITNGRGKKELTTTSKRRNQ